GGRRAADPGSHDQAAGLPVDAPRRAQPPGPGSLAHVGVSRDRGPPGGRAGLQGQAAAQVQGAIAQRTIRAIDSARSTPIAMLNTRSRRGLPRTWCTVAPKASQTKPLGSTARAKRPPRAAAWASGLPASAWRKVPAALAVTSHDFGLTHSH